MKKIIFLYASLEPYINGCIDFFSQENKDFQIIFIKNDEKEVISRFPNLKIYNSSKIEKLLNFCIDINPDLLIISGRMFPSYLKVAKYFKGKVKTVTVSDTIFDSSLRGFLKILFQKTLYHKYFGYFWGVGSLQTAHAFSIGYTKEKIFENFYVSNIDNIDFKNIFNPGNKTKILTVARLVKEKNLIQTAETIDSLNKEQNFEIQFNIIGEGPQEEELRKFNCVNLLGFKNQSEFKNIAIKNDLFCLPSAHEPWGVVLQEFANLGMPIIASYNCGSAFNLLIEGYNGYKFIHDDKLELKKKLLEFIELDDKIKIEMSKSSIKISNKITKEIWASTLKEIYNR